MKKKTSRGFTLVELMIVLVLIAIILTMGFISMTMFSGYSRQNLRDVSRQFYRDYQLVKMTAMTQNVPTRISIDQTNNSYSFYRYNMLTNSWTDLKVNVTSGPTEREFGEKVDVNQNLEFAFDPSGMVVDPNDMAIPIMVEFELSTQRDYLMDIHNIKIYPSGGIHVTRDLDQ